MSFRTDELVAKLDTATQIVDETLLPTGADPTSKYTDLWYSEERSGTTYVLIERNHKALVDGSWVFTGNYQVELEYDELQKWQAVFGGSIATKVIQYKDLPPVE